MKNQNHLPKIRFKLPSARRETEVLAAFCTTKGTAWDWSDVVFRNHPDLEPLLKGKAKKDYESAIYPYVQGVLKERRKELNALVVKYQKAWDKIGDAYLTILADRFETTYPKNRKTMTAYISIVPIYPRFIDEWSFNVSSKKPESVLPVAMHEILHFVYFKKWMEVFPKTKRNELESSHLVWRLSEILDPIILDNDPVIQELLPHAHRHYDEFKKVKVGNKSAQRHFRDLYRKHLKSREPFDAFLKKCWDDAVKHRKAIEGASRG